jgi:hypothetical protein
MARMMYVCGIALAAIGLALAVVGLASPSQMQIYGLTTETAAILLTGGVLAFGLAGVIQALTSFAEKAANPRTEMSSSQISSRLGTEPRDQLPPFRPRMPDVTAASMSAGAAAGVGAAATVAVSQFPSAAAVESTSKTSVQETIDALEQAKSDIRAALGGGEDFDAKPTPPAPPLPVKLDMPAPAVPAPSGTADAADEPEGIEAAEVEAPGETVELGPTAEGGLYVVEEQSVRGKAARVLSDGTVEAETDEGWMRFENMEHLNEYLDSVATA